LGNIQTNNGWIESKLSTVEKIATRPETAFTLTNYFLPPLGIKSALHIDSSGLVSIANADSNFPVASNFFIVGVFNSLGSTYAAATTGSGGTSMIQSLGTMDDFSLRTQIPDQGWSGPGSVMPFSTRYAFVVSNSLVHAKIIITNISGDPTSTAAQMTFIGVVAWQTNLNVKSL
jgi:hypothetical protein